MPIVIDNLRDSSEAYNAYLQRNWKLCLSECFGQQREEGYFILELVFIVLMVLLYNLFHGKNVTLWGERETKRTKEGDERKSIDHGMVRV